MNGQIGALDEVVEPDSNQLADAAGEQGTWNNAAHSVNQVVARAGAAT
jgi:hypothetical protein